MRKHITIFALLVACFLLVPSVRGEENGKIEKIFKAVIAKDGVQHIDILGGSYFFDPNHIIVKVNVPVELKVRKEPGITPHDIVMKSPEAGMDFKESMDAEPKTIRFTPTKVGIYPFYCDKKLLFFESHKKKGMEGVVEVIE
jgi:plastocyanin domain-containing protein